MPFDNELKLPDTVLPAWLKFLDENCQQVGPVGCITFRPGTKHVHFLNREGRFRVEFRSWIREACNIEVNERLQPMAHQVVKVLARCPERSALGETLVCSHVCHNKVCVNPLHISAEPQCVNEDRTRCVTEHCKHLPPCLCDGTEARKLTLPQLVFDKSKMQWIPHRDVIELSQD